MQRMTTAVMIATLALIYWVGTRIYLWRKAFDGTAWTVTSEGVSESLNAAGKLGLGDLTSSPEGVTGIGTMPDAPATPLGSGQIYSYGSGSGPTSAPPPSKAAGNGGAEDPCTMTLLQLSWEQAKVAATYLPGGKPAGEKSAELLAWCACQERTYGEYFRQCGMDMADFQGEW